MTVWAPFVVIQAAGADAPTATLTPLETAAAVVVFACYARANATRTAAVLAATADIFTFAADSFTALLARVAVVLVHTSAAIGAAAAMPQRELHKRAFRVIGPQNAGHEHEKIQ
jgi:hypothetical protein